ncbi:exodeoxyribonuclease VII small subunit [Marmoricola sp. URHA0025 HA25]
MPEPAKSQQPPDDGEQLSYEEARDQLVEVVRTLEQGGTTLAESLTLWERGEELARICQTSLDGARQRLDAVIGDAGE